MSHSFSEEFNMIANAVRSPASDEFVESARDDLRADTQIVNSPVVNSEDVAYLNNVYSDMMSNPSDPSIDRSHLFTCTGDNNCMYRSVMTMLNNYDLNSLEWVTGFTRCLPDTPVCPPLTVFNDETNACDASDE